MKAFRLTDWSAPPVLCDLDPPVPRAGQVLVRVAAAGACHSDLHLLDAAPGTFPYPAPFTLGHEIAGQVAALGPGATGVEMGDQVVVYGPWGCGECSRCAVGQDNYCDRRGALTWAGAGLGRDGGMAGYVVVPAARHLVRIGDLDPVQAAPLADAGLTPFHAVSRLAGQLGDGSTAAVIGVGGLGHLAVQILSAVTSCRVFAVDIREAALDFARRAGAELATLTRPDTRQVLRAATGGTGVDAVFDFVGSTATLELAAACLRPGGELVVVGSGNGRLTISKPGAVPQGGRVWLPFWGARAELGEVIALARAGRLHVEVERFPLSEAGEAFARLRAGRISGRAVLIPDGD